MELNSAQYKIIHDAVIANGVFALYSEHGDTSHIYNWCNADSTYIVWRSTTNVSDIEDAILWANFTPANPVAGAGQDFANWSLACQGKQFNLQNILSSSYTTGFISTGRPTIRSGLQDALTQIPSGVSGAIKSAGWTNVLTAIQRPATNAERLFAIGAGTSALPGVLGEEGIINWNEIVFITEA